jgi:opacity protein-like surface antigen
MLKETQMRLKPYIGLTLAFFFVGAAHFTLSQTAPAASEARVPLAIGAGLSAYNPDWQHGHLIGGTLWIDYTLPRVPSLLRGLGIEAEARDLNYGRSSTQPPNLRQDTAGGGLIYSWYHYSNFRPYAKFFAGYGNTDEYSPRTQYRYHDSRNFLCGGGGMEFRTLQNLWVRFDYEYQSWPDFFKAGKPPGRMTPQGFTIGALYHFDRFHSRY